MQQSGKKVCLFCLKHPQYGFNMLVPEEMSTIPSLFSTVKAFLADNPFVQPSRLFKMFTSDGSQSPSSTTDYNGLHFWSNFEIGMYSFYLTRAQETSGSFGDQNIPTTSTTLTRLGDSFMSAGEMLRSILWRSGCFSQNLRCIFLVVFLSSLNYLGRYRIRA